MPPQSARSDRSEEIGNCKVRQSGVFPSVCMERTGSDTVQNSGNENSFNKVNNDHVAEQLDALLNEEAEMRCSAMMTLKPNGGEG